MKDTYTEEPFYLKLHRHRVPTRIEFHQHFGGTIYEHDFNYCCKQNSPARNGSEIAARIEQDFRREKLVLRDKYLARLYEQNA